MSVSTQNPAEIRCKKCNALLMKASLGAIIPANDLQIEERLDTLELEVKCHKCKSLMTITRVEIIETLSA